MNNQEDNQRESATSQVLTVETAVDSEKKLDNTTSLEIASAEKAKTLSKSYQRSRNVALMKLGFLRGEESEAE
jgi:hypothetical protein